VFCTWLYFLCVFVVSSALAGTDPYAGQYFVLHTPNVRGFLLIFTDSAGHDTSMDARLFGGGGFVVCWGRGFGGGDG